MPDNETSSIIAALRKEYRLGSLDKVDLDPDPFKQFHQWFEHARSVISVDPNAMTIATASSDAKPSARMVLLKDYDEQGFVFYTNYESTKAKNIAKNPWAAILFHWVSLERQVRIVGVVEKVSADQTASYFRSRPLESQLGAWVSRQSDIIDDRTVLEHRLTELKEKYKDTEVPVPAYWGGYRLIPDEFEFWQGRESRLHDRFSYRKEKSGWKIDRLSP